MNSRYLQLLAAALIAVASVLGPTAANGSLFRLSWTQEATIADIRAALTARDLTCRQLVQGYIDRIEAYGNKGPALNAIIMINPNALAAADALDTKFAQSGFVGPLHCVPLIVKDNFNTADADNGRLAAKVANECLERTGDDGRAIREANAVVARQAEDD